MYGPTPATTFKLSGSPVGTRIASEEDTAVCDEVLLLLSFYSDS
jgi:hypothetical protein